MESQYELATLQHKLNQRKDEYTQAKHSRLSFSTPYSIQILPTSFQHETMVGLIATTRENLAATESQHTKLIEENRRLRKQLEDAREGRRLQEIRSKYYIQLAYSRVRGDSIFALDERILHITLRNLLSDLSTVKLPAGFPARLTEQIDNASAKLTRQT